MLAVSEADGCNTISSHQNRDKTSDEVPVVLQRGGEMVSYRVTSEFGTYQHGDKELLVQPPASAGTGHTITEIEEASPTGTDFLINPEFGKCIHN
ncbi:hypothetical protein MAR_002581 [Mya arenaria]|uniref:Uncharacterized protein n=1 Tax=Mya arenaria TaxID=6604 RepID=A0ABY7G3I4_MYAAR|nr:hypothetical protein MAR_002581 [Mya arenaria]